MNSLLRELGNGIRAQYRFEKLWARPTRPATVNNQRLTRQVTAFVGGKKMKHPGEILRCAYPSEGCELLT